MTASKPGSYGDNTFYNTGLKILCPDGINTVNISTATNEAANRVMNLPAMGADDTLVSNTTFAAQLAANTTGLTPLFTSVTLATAAIKTLYSAPTVIIAAPGAGLSIVVVKALARFVYGSTQYTSGGAVQLQYDSTVNAGGVTPLSTVAAGVIQAAASSDTIMNSLATSVTAGINKGIYASCATADFATSVTGSLTFKVWYFVI